MSSQLCCEMEATLERFLLIFWQGLFTQVNFYLFKGTGRRPWIRHVPHILNKVVTGTSCGGNPFISVDIDHRIAVVWSLSDTQSAHNNKSNKTNDGFFSCFKPPQITNFWRIIIFFLLNTKNLVKHSLCLLIWIQFMVKS